MSGLVKEQLIQLLTPLASTVPTKSGLNKPTLGLNVGVKRMEVGLINTREPMTLYLYSERFPIWLFSLDASWCHQLVIVGYTSLPDFMLLLATGEQEMLELVLDPFIQRNVVTFLASARFKPIQNESTFVLMSGNLYSFLVPKLAQYQTCQIIGIVDSHCPGRLRNGTPTSHDSDVAHQISRLRFTKWLRLRHSSTGGPTDFIALLAFVNIATFPQASVLQRGIRHVFNAGIRPGPPPRNLISPHYGVYYQMDDRLCPGLYHLPVLCTTHYYSSGHGYRVLTTDELATAHGFPRHVTLPNFPIHFLEYPPCQILSASLDPIWIVKEDNVTDLNPRPSK